MKADWSTVEETHRPLSMSVAEKAKEKALEEQFAEVKRRFEALRIPRDDQVFKPKPLRDKLIWVGVDLDGTLAEPLWTPENPTSDIGNPIPANIKKVWKLVNAGYKVIVHTSRPWTDYQVIEQWLQHYDIPYKEIQCGKPLYAAYVDDRAINAQEDSWLPR